MDEGMNTYVTIFSQGCNELSFTVTLFFEPLLGFSLFFLFRFGVQAGLIMVACLRVRAKKGAHTHVPVHTYY